MTNSTQINKTKKHVSIKWKIFGYLLLFCGVLVLLMWLLQIVFLDDFYRSIKTNTIKDAASYVEKNINSENLELLINEVSKNNDISIEIIDDNGTTVIKSVDNRNNVLLRMPTIEKVLFINNAIENNGTFLTDVGKTEANDMNITFIGQMPGGKLDNNAMILTKLVTTSDNQTYAIMVSASVQPMDDTVSTLKTQLWFVTGFMIIVAIIIATIIARWISKPIVKINQKAKLLQTGDFSVNFDASGYKEIDELSQTMDETAVELGKVEDLRKELIANTSHDLRTPLTLISGYAEAMRDLPGENTPENAQIIIDETNRLNTIVSDILDFSKYQDGTLKLDKEEYDIASNITQSINNMNAFLKKDGYEIKYEGKESVLVNADKSKINQVFYNLLINAINYTGEDKKVFVKLIDEDDKVKVEVKDDGAGISEDDIKYIWDRYYKADKNHKRPVTGSGIGLSIVKSVINLHNGEYGVNSKENEGSTFWFSIPKSL